MNFPFLEQYERDSETGLDFAQARYFASVQGRFTSPDDFFNDSHPADPQSWNLYTYVRNNPLKYVDPTGRNATVTVEIDEKNKRGKITITASIAIYASDKLKSKGYNDKALGVASKGIKSGIEKSWSGEFKRDGITYTVETTVDVQLANDKQGAISTGAQNVVEIVGVDEISTRFAVGETGRDPANRDASYDFGRWTAGINSTGAGHEFGHFLGVNDRSAGNFLMMNNPIPSQDVVSGATQSDYEWAFGGLIEPRKPQMVFGPAPYAHPRHGTPRSGTVTGQVRVPKWPWGWK